MGFVFLNVKLWTLFVRGNIYTFSTQTQLFVKMTQSVHTSWVISGSILFSFVTTQNNCSKRMFWLLPYFPGVAAADWSTLDLTQMWRHLCGRKLLTPWLWVCPPDLRSGIFCIDKRVFYYHASCFALCSLLLKKSQLPKGFAHIILVLVPLKKYEQLQAYAWLPLPKNILSLASSLNAAV